MWSTKAHGRFVLGIVIWHLIAILVLQQYVPFFLLSTTFMFKIYEKE